jgi:hypothetical protein
LLIAVYFLPSFLVVATGKGQLQNRHPKARHLLLWPVTGKFARVKLIEESVGGEVYEGRNKEPWI